MKTKYIAIEPIFYSGKIYQQNSEIELEESDAKQLLELGHIKLSGEVETSTEPDAEPVAEPVTESDAEPAATKDKGKK